MAHVQTIVSGAQEGDYRAWLRLQGGQLASVGAGFDYNDERIGEQRLVGHLLHSA